MLCLGEATEGQNIPNIIIEVAISPEKLFYGEKKSIALYYYSSAHTLYGVYG